MLETSDMNGVQSLEAHAKGKIYKRDKADFHTYSNNSTANNRAANNEDWYNPGVASAKQKVASNLSSAARNLPDRPESFSHAMTYADHNLYGTQPAQEEFGFADVVDMVNPLQHIPFVNTIYREVTGDEIKPISQIVGGAVFSGGLGAASGLVNVVVEHETGKDIAGNMMNFVDGHADGGNGGLEDFAPPPRGLDHPEIQLNKVAREFEDGRQSAYEELPANVLGFTDLGYGKREVYTEHKVADGRTAGRMTQSHTEVAAPNDAPREPISEVEFAPFRGLNTVREMD